MSEIKSNNELILNHCTNLENQLLIIDNLISSINKAIDDIYSKDIDIKEILGFDFNYLDYSFSNTLRKWLLNTKELVARFNNLSLDSKNHAYILEKQKAYLDLCIKIQNRAIEETIDLASRLEETKELCQIFDDDYSLN